MRLRISIALLTLVSGGTAYGFGAFNTSSLQGGTRWDAAPRTIGGVERSLAGGLRYSLAGGSYQAFRDQFSWNGSPPPVADFQHAIEDAFGAWTVRDPVSGLGTNLSFVYDPNTTATFNRATGAEIDLIGNNFGDNRLRGDTFLANQTGPVTLTSGTASYNSLAISGVDIRINTSSTALFTLPIFRILLTHELGHALGLDDVDLASGPGGRFIDDNYDGSLSSTALATLSNSFAHRINPLNPAASVGLRTYIVANADPGFDTDGVNILMESAIRGSFFLSASPALQNDDFAGRQFLYPVIPEPASITWVALAVALVARRASLPKRQKGL